MFLGVSITLIVIMHFFGYTTRLNPYHPPLSWHEIYLSLPKIISAAFLSAVMGIFVLYVAERDKKRAKK